MNIQCEYCDKVVNGRRQYAKHLHDEHAWTYETLAYKFWPRNKLSLGHSTKEAKCA